jgi:hypothetical protein
MNYALVPDNKPARVIRFCPAGVLAAGLIAVLDTRKNLLLVSLPRWLRLSDSERHAVIRTDQAELRADRHLQHKLFGGRL